MELWVGRVRYATDRRRLNDVGHRSREGKPFTHAIVLDLRRAHHMPSHIQRLRARGLLDIAEVAERVGVHPSTIKAWHRAGLLVSHKANGKNQRLFEPPTPGDPRLVKHMGSRIEKRVTAQPAPEGAV